jgi:hypothetical protein
VQYLTGSNVQINEEKRMNAKVLFWDTRRRRNWKRDALMIAGLAGVGSAIGAATGGKRGATIGALSAGVGRFIMRLAGR